jgi:hypothetical protein
MHSPGCATKELARLMFLHKSGEPPGDPKHQIGYEHDVVEICSACNGATLERLRHDCFDFEEVWDQYEWYELSPEDGTRLREVAARCAQPLNPFCTCAEHRSLCESARALPVSSWDAVFERATHRHTIRLSAVGTARFTLVQQGVAPKPGDPKNQLNAKPVDIKGVAFIFLAWPAVLLAFVVAWFRLVHLPWFIDAPIVFVAIPLSFLVAGVILALGSVIAKRR